MRFLGLFDVAEKEEEDDDDDDEEEGEVQYDEEDE